MRKNKIIIMPDGKKYFVYHANNMLTSRIYHFCAVGIDIQVIAKNVIVI